MKVNGQYDFPARKELDLRLPNGLLGFTVFTAIAFVGMILLALFYPMQPGADILLTCFGAVVFAVGILVAICWRNQVLYMLNSETLLYRTMFGNVYRLNVKDIQYINTSMDSLQIVFLDRKVHVEKMSVVSPRFRALLLEKGAWSSHSPLR